MYLMLILFPFVAGGGNASIYGNIILLSFDVGTLRILFWNTFTASSSALCTRCLFTTEVKIIGTSVNGAIRFLISSSNFFAVFVSFSIRSHLFTSNTTPFLFLSQRWNIFKSCAVIPAVASINIKHTSASSIARMERITE